MPHCKTLHEKIGDNLVKPCIILFDSYQWYYCCMLLRMPSDKPNGDGSGGWIPSMRDKRIAKLSEEAGSEKALSRGKYIAAGIIVLGCIGALGSAVRPLLRQRFAANAAAVTARQRSRPITPETSAQLENVLGRLRHLQSLHQQRHPLWYGRPTDEMIAQAEKELAAQHAPSMSTPEIR